MVMKMFSSVVIILVIVIFSTSGQEQEDWKIELKETLVMTRQLIELVQKFNKDPFEYHYCANGGVSFLNPEPICLCADSWTGHRCDENPCNDVGCNTGTCYADSNGLPHCVCPVGTSGQFCEIKESCLQLETPSNAQVHVVTTYTCKNNYSLCGPKNTTCDSETGGSRTTPVCIEPYTGDTNLTVKFGGSTYYFSGDETERSFKNAQKYCENLGGNLLSVNSADEWNFIKCVTTEETRRHKGRIRWLGLSKSNDIWAWTSGEPLKVSYWHKYYVDNPHFNCGIMISEVWAAANGCTIEHKFICKINKR